MRFGNIDDAEFPGGTVIPGYGYYLILDNDSTNTELRAKADALIKRTFALENDYVVCLGIGAMTDNPADDVDTIDYVGFGTDSPWYERKPYSGGPAPAIPEGKSLQRKVNATITEDGYGPAWDSNDNSADFFIQDSPNPQNSTWTVEHRPLPPVPELPSIFLLAIGLIALAGYALYTKRNKRRSHATSAGIIREKRRRMKKKYWQFLVVFALFSVLPLCPTSASASIFTNAGNGSYAIQINNLSCELTDYEVQVDLWHLSINGSYTAMLNNSGDTAVSIRWNEGYSDTTPQENRIIIPANTVKKYHIYFSFHLLSRELSYDYVEL